MCPFKLWQWSTQGWSVLEWMTKAEELYFDVCWYQKFLIMIVDRKFVPCIKTATGRFRFKHLYLPPEHPKSYKDRDQKFKPAAAAVRDERQWQQILVISCTAPLLTLLQLQHFGSPHISQKSAVYLLNAIEWTLY